MRALGWGESIDSVIAAVSLYRQNDKWDPEPYAAHMVPKAAAALESERFSRERHWA